MEKKTPKEDKRYCLGKKKTTAQDYTDEENQQYIQESETRIKDLSEEKLKLTLVLKDKLRERQEATEEWERLQMQPSELNRYEREVKEHEFSIDLLKSEIKNSRHYNNINNRPSITSISKVPSE